MKIVDSNRINREYIDWDDIEYGDVFAYTDKESTEKWIGMKVCNPDGGDMIVDFETFEVYNDISNYNYVEILDAKLKINISNNAD